MRLARRVTDRGVTPPGKSLRPTFQSLPVSYEPLPGRRKDGWALDYVTYVPSMYYVQDVRRMVRWEGDVEAEIASRIDELRLCLHDMEDVDMLREEQTRLEKALNALRIRMDRVRLCIEEAGGTSPVVVRKVSGRPRRGFSGRSTSMSKRRRWGAGEDNDTVSRKPSGRLRRLGSAGGMLIRRLSRVSVNEDRMDPPGWQRRHTASGGTAANEEDRESMQQAAKKAEILKKYDDELKDTEAEAMQIERSLDQIRARIERWQELHTRSVKILDGFYGSLPGWEENAVARRMLPQVAEMTEGALEAERDLVQARREKEQVRAAKEDYERALKALRGVGDCLQQVSEDGAERLKRRAKMLVGIAKECCSLGRVEQLERDINEMDMNDIGAVSCECKLAETFVAERLRLITEDIQACARRVEQSERDVVLERLSILNLFHPQ